MYIHRGINLLLISQSTQSTYFFATDMSLIVSLKWRPNSPAPQPVVEDPHLVAVDPTSEVRYLHRVRRWGHRIFIDSGSQKRPETPPSSWFTCEKKQTVKGVVLFLMVHSHFHQGDGVIRTVEEIPSRELTYPPKMAFWRWFSFSQGGIC